jgi:hypothetical protein
MFGDIFLENLYLGVDEEYSGSMEVAGNTSIQVD